MKTERGIPCAFGEQRRHSKTLETEIFRIKENNQIYVDAFVQDSTSEDLYARRLFHLRNTYNLIFSPLLVFPKEKT